ncbi:hypothetical protein LWI29_003140 [Acer saccharum]|uniref:Reverse transcriptase domain-containing protein n=1 Tax=Acer saccharum TaxID=4024 RepID=A0AA39RG17_ACESA|nr:hypothetical protein LWI29_003140 [Acer saccharum]
MHPDDQEKTAFVTERGTFCYKVMPFGLKNAGATYQRLVNKMFAKMLGSTMEVYIDDMLVKSLVAQQHIDHLRQSFDVLDEYGMKLNPTKCSFGVSSGKFLGYLKLTGRVAALNRFISKSSERCLPFFNTLRKNKAFKWNDDCEKALQDLKTYLKSLPLLSKPKDNETLFVYLAVSDTSVSAILVREEENNQHPVYYVSKTLLDAETRYSRLEKLALALVVAARKLRPYFQCHSIKSTFDEFPIEQIPRSENTRADALASLGSTITNGSKSVPIVHLMSPSIQELEILAPVDNGRSWIEPIFSYLQADILPDDRVEARKIKAKAAKFCILYGKLYKKSFTGPYLRCVTPREVYDVLKSLHYEECENHSGARSLSNRAITVGYYWPTMRTDS